MFSQSTKSGPKFPAVSRVKGAAREEVKMFRLVGVAVSFGLLIGATNYAQAAYPCGEGYTLQDGFCKPYRPYYGGGYYGGGYYGGGPYYYGGGPYHYGGGPYYYGRPYRRHYRQYYRY